MDTRYREHAPSPELRSHVSCYWSRSTPPGTETRVIPDGAVDILFDLAASSPKEAFYAVGTMTRPLIVSPKTTSQWIAIRFRPGGVHPLLGVSMHELTDRRVPLDVLLPGAADWAERLHEIGSLEERIGIVEALVLERIRSSSAPAPEARVHEAVRRLEASGGARSVSSLAVELDLTRQHLKRLFERQVGVGVKFFARVVRLQSVLNRAARAGVRPDWARFASEAGYFDHTHMIADFRSLTGLSPVRLQETRSRQPRG